MKCLAVILIFLVTVAARTQGARWSLNYAMSQMQFDTDGYSIGQPGGGSGQEERGRLSSTQCRYRCTLHRCLAADYDRKTRTCYLHMRTQKEQKGTSAPTDRNYGILRCRDRCRRHRCLTLDYDRKARTCYLHLRSKKEPKGTPAPMDGKHHSKGSKIHECKQSPHHRKHERAYVFRRQGGAGDVKITRGPGVKYKRLRNIHTIQFSGRRGSYVTGKRFDKWRHSFTVSFYFKTTKRATQTLVGNWANRKWQYLFRLMSSGKLQLHLRRNRYNTGSDPRQDMVIVTGGRVVGNRWYHVAFSWDHRTGEARIYLNTRMVARRQSRHCDRDLFRWPSSRFALGYKQDSHNEYFKGDMAKLVFISDVVPVCKLRELAHLLDQLPRPEKPGEKPVDISRFQSWLLLGPSINSKPTALHGLRLSTNGRSFLTRGPDGLNAWVFSGRNYIRIQGGRKLNLQGESFTIATYVYQEVVKDGPIVEWRGRGPYGTHLWIYKRKFFTNLDAVRGRSALSFHTTPAARKWSFVGVSFNHKTGNLMMWVDDKVLNKKVGVLGIRDMIGDLYIGVRPARPRHKFTGKLAGTTLVKGAIIKDQIPALKKQIIARAKPTVQLPDPNKPVDLSRSTSWLLLGPKMENKPRGLHGLTLASVGGGFLTKGPDGLNAWVFTGYSYVRIVSGGTLNLQSESFTLATYIYQNIVSNGPIVEWRGRGPHGTHLWIHQKKLYTNLDDVGGHRILSYHTAPAAKKWAFVGISFNRLTGNLMMWVDDKVLIKEVGYLGFRDMAGDLYIGARPANLKYKFSGMLAGTTLMKDPINKSQIAALKKLIIARAKPTAQLPDPNKPVDISRCTSWLLLGPKIENKPSGLNGLTLTMSGRGFLTRGPDGLNAWDFSGSNYVKVTSGGKLNLQSESFTIATFVYQTTVRDGPIIEWRGRGTSGTHMWFWKKKLFANLDAASRGTAYSYHTAPAAKKWSFVGVSFNHKTGNLMMWVDDKVLNKKVGVLGIRDMVGDLYIGVRPARPRYKFTGKLAGTTLMKCPIDAKQIPAFKKQVISRAKDSGLHTTHICEGYQGRITCRKGTVISVAVANYGRTDSKVCTKGKTASQLKTNCNHQSVSLSKVLNRCDGKITCAIAATNAVFGDPCAGTYKYLGVKYICQIVRTSLICEGNTHKMTCQTGTSINIIAANYGRTDPKICAKGKPAIQTKKIDCNHQRVSLTKVKGICNGKQSCVLSASDAIFTDPCVGTFKYLDVKFTCKAK